MSSEHTYEAITSLHLSRVGKEYFTFIMMWIACFLVPLAKVCLTWKRDASGVVLMKQI